MRLGNKCLGLGFVFVTSCIISSGTKAANIELPSWYYEDNTVGYIVSSTCVDATSSFQNDEKLASLNARIELSKAVSSEIEVQSKLISDNSNEAAQILNEMATSLSETTLRGSMISKRAHGEVNGKSLFCVQARIAESVLKGTLTSLLGKVKEKDALSKVKSIINSIDSSSIKSHTSRLEN